MDVVELNAAQRSVLEALGTAAADRPRFDPSLKEALRHELEGQLGPSLAILPPEEQLWVNKYALAKVHGCEASFVADQAEPFEWSTSRAKGTITHKAIELTISWRGEANPMDLVDEAMARSEMGDSSLGTWLASCSEGDRAELRSLANEHVAKFLECFPPLRSKWRPVAEASLRYEACGGRAMLQGRVDLTVGAASGDVAGKVLIDHKTGASHATHIDDLRFYALVETLRLGTPPRLLATYYLDSGQLPVERVTEDLLWAALARTVDGVCRLVEVLHGGREPVRRPGRPCRWCVLNDTCTQGRAWLDHDDAVI